MRVLLTNDDGIEAEGLRTLRRALVRIDGIELVVVAPATNQSATARSITTRRPLAVHEVRFKDGTIGYAPDGTPVDCVRLANLGLVEGFAPQLVVSGINHGANVGDDITYSGTVAAALEAVLLGLPGIAVSQQPGGGELDLRSGNTFDFERAAAFTARLVAQLPEVGLRPGALLNVNVPAGQPTGVTVVRLGRRVYHDKLVLRGERDGVRSYTIYGEAGQGGPGPDGHHATDLEALAAGQIAVTPLHFDLTDLAGMPSLERFDLARLIAPAAQQVAEG